MTITGTGFTGATAVDFGGRAATNVTVHSSTSMTATAPADAAGVTDVTVTGPSGVSPTSPADQFTYTVLGTPASSGCSPSCTVHSSSPLNGTAVTVTGSSTSPTAKVTLLTNTANLNCGKGYNYVAPISTLTPTGFAPTSTLTVTQTLSNQLSTAGVKVCFQAKGSPSPKALTACGTKKIAPCLLSLTKVAGNKVTAKFLSPAKDPKWRVGGALVTVTSFSPTSAARKATVTITGTNLTQVTSVVIGGATAPMKLPVTATKVVVTVPQNARTSLITLSGNSGSVTSAKVLTVT